MVVGLEVVGEAEVGDLDVHVGVQEQVLSLEIPMDDVVGVAVVDGFDNLPELLPRQGLRHSPMAGNVF